MAIGIRRLLPWLLLGGGLLPASGCDSPSGWITASGGSAEAVEGGYFLGEVDFSFHGTTAQARGFERGGRIEVEMVLRSTSASDLFWVRSVPGCHWFSSDESEAVRRDSRPAEGEEVETDLLMGVGCDWFEDDRPPTPEEIESWRWPPGESRELQFSFQPDDWTENDAARPEGGQTVWASWRFQGETSAPRAAPPELHPDSWSAVHLEFRWDEAGGFRLRLL